MQVYRKVYRQNLKILVDLSKNHQNLTFSEHFLVFNKCPSISNRIKIILDCAPSTPECTHVVWFDSYKPFFHNIKKSWKYGTSWKSREMVPWYQCKTRTRTTSHMMNPRIWKHVSIWERARFTALCSKLENVCHNTIFYNTILEFENMFLKLRVIFPDSAITQL